MSWGFWLDTCESCTIWNGWLIYYGICWWDKFPFTLMSPFGSETAILACESTKQLFSLLTWKNETLGILAISSLIFYFIIFLYWTLGQTFLMRLWMVFFESPTTISCCSCNPLSNCTLLIREYSSSWLLVDCPKLHGYFISWFLPRSRVTPLAPATPRFPLDAPSKHRICTFCVLIQSKKVDGGIWSCQDDLSFERAGDQNCNWNLSNHPCSIPSSLCGEDNFISGV